MLLINKSFSYYNPWLILNIPAIDVDKKSIKYSIAMTKSMAYAIAVQNKRINARYVIRKAIFPWNLHQNILDQA